MKFYIASSFSNKQAVRKVSEKLKSKGFVHTYDWTKNERASSFEQLSKLGNLEKDAVMEADFMIALLPAGKGSHIEFGIALGQGKPIYLYSSDEAVNNFDTTSTFYHLPQVKVVVGTINDLIQTILLDKQNISNSRMLHK